MALLSQKNYFKLKFFAGIYSTKEYSSPAKKNSLLSIRRVFVDYSSTNSSPWKKKILRRTKILRKVFVETSLANSSPCVQMGPNETEFTIKKIKIDNSLVLGSMQLLHEIIISAQTQKKL